MTAPPLQRMEPIGWVVQSDKGRALVLERPAADAMAVKVHGTGLRERLGAAAAAGRCATQPCPGGAPCRCLIRPCPGPCRWPRWA